MVIAIVIVSIGTLTAPALGSTPTDSQEINLPLREFRYGGSSSGPVTAYPTGCSGQNILYRSRNVLTASTLSSCTYQVQRIWHKITIYRSRWYGWEPLVSVTDWRNNVYSFAKDLPYNCTGTGTHTFRAKLEGQVVTHSGQIYNGGAYDEIENVNCG